MPSKPPRSSEDAAAFEFINVVSNPQDARAKNKTRVRANATKFRWRHALEEGDGQAPSLTKKDRTSQLRNLTPSSQAQAATNEFDGIFHVITDDSTKYVGNDSIGSAKESILSRDFVALEGDTLSPPNFTPYATKAILATGAHNYYHNPLLLRSPARDSFDPFDVSPSRLPAKQIAECFSYCECYISGATALKSFNSSTQA